VSLDLFSWGGVEGGGEPLKSVKTQKNANSAICLFDTRAVDAACRLSTSKGAIGVLFKKVLCNPSLRQAHT
jgi:hypothetical protein